MTQDQPLLVKIERHAGGEAQGYVLTWSPRQHELPAVSVRLPLDQGAQASARKLVSTFIELAPDALGEGFTGRDVEAELAEAREYGRRLFAGLTDAAPALAHHLKEHPPARLILDCPHGWNAQPWELLYDGADFLALHCPMLRRPSAGQAALPEAMKEPFPLPLQVLGLSYSPRGRDVDPQGHWREVHRALADVSPLVELRVLDDQERQGLLDQGRLPEHVQRADVLHILAHGSDASQGDPLLHLGKQFSGGELSKLLKGALKGVRLVILASCNSGCIDADRKSMAESFLEAGVPAVIAMQYDISPPAALQFVSALYRSLADGDPLDQAVLQGRQRIHGRMSSSIEWMTPVLYTALEGEELKLFRPLSPAERHQRAAYLAALQAATRAPAPDELPIRVSRAAADEAGLAEGWGQLAATAGLHAFAEEAGPTRGALEVLLEQVRRPESRVTILLGEPGSGKELALEQLVAALLEGGQVERAAADPRAHIPIRVSLDRVGADAHSYPLENLLLQGIAQVLAGPGAPGPGSLYDAAAGSAPAAALPRLQEVVEWTRSLAWCFVVMLEGLENIPPEQRPEVGRALRRLADWHGQHLYILTATTSAYQDYVPYLGQHPAWQIAPMRVADVRAALGAAGIAPEQRERAGLNWSEEDPNPWLRQPWVLLTLRQMGERGEPPRDQAGLLLGRIHHLLERVPRIGAQFLRTRARKTLMKLALELHANPRLGVDDLFRLMADIRSQRTYDLEELFRDLVNGDLILVDDQTQAETVRFQSPYLHGMLAALALDQALQENRWEELANFAAHVRLGDTPMATALVLLAQLREEHVGRVCQQLMERLEPLAGQWDERLALLELVVRCLQHRPAAAGQALRLTVIRELAGCLVGPADEARLVAMKPDCLRGAMLDTQRLSRNGLRVQAARLLGYLGDGRAFEPLRWLMLERVWLDSQTQERDFAVSSLRRAAAQAAFRLWRARALASRLDGDPDLEQLEELMAAWEASRRFADEEERSTSQHALERLVTWLGDTQAPWLNSLAALPIAEIGAWPEHPQHECAIQALTDAFVGARSDKMWAIADGVAALGGLSPQDVPALGRMTAVLIEVVCARREGEFVHYEGRRAAAVYALGKLRQAEALEVLLAALALPDLGEDERVRAWAARALGEIGQYHPDHPKLPPVREALKDMVRAFPEDAWPREEAIRALGWVGGGEDVVAALLQVLRDDPALSETAGDPHKVHRWALIALQQILGRERIAQRLLDELQPGDPEAVRRLLWALGEVADEWLGEALRLKLAGWQPSLLQKVEAEWARVQLKTQAEKRPPPFPGRDLQVMAHLEKDKQLRGPDVFQVECRLWELGYACSLRYIRQRFTADTERAVRAFQESHPKELRPTSVVDRQTWFLLFSPYACQGPGGLYGLGPEDGPPPELAETLEYRSDAMLRGEMVRLVQSCLWDLGYAEQLVWIDAVYGKNTEKAVRLWQQQSGRKATGRIEPGDWEALRRQWEAWNQGRARPGRAC
jgi:HEAT repeat protein